MPYAKQNLRAWGLLIARPGTWVSDSAVQKFGWQDQVTEDEPTIEITTPPKRRRRKAT